MTKEGKPTMRKSNKADTSESLNHFSNENYDELNNTQNIEVSIQ